MIDCALEQHSLSLRNFLRNIISNGISNFQLQFQFPNCLEIPVFMILRLLGISIKQMEIVLEHKSMLLKFLSSTEYTLQLKVQQRRNFL